MIHYERGEDNRIIVDHKDLLKRQSKGEKLNRFEKNAAIELAKANRKSNKGSNKTHKKKKRK